MVKANPKTNHNVCARATGSCLSLRALSKAAPVSQHDEDRFGSQHSGQDALWTQ